MCGVVYGWFICELMAQASQLDTLSQHFPARTHTGHQDPLECPSVTLVQLFPPTPPPSYKEQKPSRQLKGARQTVHTVGLHVSEE